MNEEIKEKLKTKIAISQIKNEEEKAMNKKENFIFKNIGIAACVLMSLTESERYNFNYFNRKYMENTRKGTNIFWRFRRNNKNNRRKQTRKYD